MGKCISKHPSVLTIALSEKDLTRANQIWSKFAESTEYIALKDKHGNQLCEYYYVSGKKTKTKQQKAESKPIAVQTIQPTTDRDNDAKNSSTTIRMFGGAKQTTSTAYQNSNENQKQNQNMGKKKSKSKKIAKAVQKQSSTQQQQQHESNAANNISQSTTTTTITSGIESYTENLWQDCITSTITEVTNVDATQTTPTNTTIMYPYVNIVNNCEYCTFDDVGGHYDDNGHEIGVNDDDNKNCDDDTNNKYEEHIFAFQSHNKCAEVVVVDNTCTTTTTCPVNILDAHKSQQHCLAHLLLQPNAQNDGDNNNVADANNDGKIAKQQQQQQYVKLVKLAQNQTLITNAEVYNDNIGVKNSTAQVDEGNGVGVEQSASNYLAALSSIDMEGQAESKKHLKKHGGNTTGTLGTGGGVIETKGTAMSFGFRKKLNTTPKKFKKLLEAGVGVGGDSKRKQDKCNNITTTTTEHDGNTMSEDNGKPGTVIKSADNEEICAQQQEQIHDDNGNAELLAKVHFEKMGAAATTTQQRGGNHSNTNLPGVASRFGYRGSNIVRPASAGAGLTQRSQMDIQDSTESNNNYGNNGNSNNNRNGGLGVSGQQKPLVSNLKRRSKSAHAGRALTSGDEASESGSGTDAAGRPKISQPKSITFNLSQNSTIEYQRRQFFEQPSTYGGSYGSGGRSTTHNWTHQPTTHHSTQAHQSRNVINTGMHTNVIVRPTPRAPPATFSKFTLHTVSLPKPEFPVAISVGASTPTTPGTIYTPSPTMITTTAGARAKDIQMQHPLTVVASAAITHNTAGPHMDLKTAKQMANNTRRGFSGSREISADSGISCMDAALDSSLSSACGSNGGRTASPKRSRSRPRNLQMVMNGRHKFEVRDLDDPLSSEGSSIVEPLALPKLPNENQTAPLPLCGLVRSNTVLSRESYERNGGIVGNKSAPSGNQEVTEVNAGKPRPTTAPAQCVITRNSSEESEGVDEEKLYLDRSTSEKGNRFKDINTCSSKTSSPGSSIMLSWCNAGESLAVKDCSSLSISSEDSNKLHEDGRKDKDSDTEKNDKKEKKAADDLNDDDLSGIVTDMQSSTLSSLTETLPEAATRTILRTNTPNATTFEIPDTDKPDRPKSFYNTLNETKFAEMALAGSTYLLDDETSPTDSLVSSTESEEAACKQQKHKLNEELQEKDIDEISPELEMASPISPGSPTHASHSLSLSDCGNLIDDEIADQPALLFNSEAHDLVDSLASHKDKTDTPTLMENTGSIRSLKSLSKARTALQQAIELSLRTPLSLRKAVMERADSLDTLSPCESICSEDLMMDFDMHSSVDSIDRSSSIKSRSGSDLDKIGETELFSEFERKGSDVMKELNSILRQHTNKSTEKDSIIAHLPARATRLLNRSRLQQQQYPSSNFNGASASASAGTSGGGGGGGTDSDSSRSTQSLRRSTAGSRASNASTSSTNASLPPNNHLHQQKPFQHHYTQLHRDSHSSSDDLMLYDKSFRNAMIQDVLQFKKQLLRLRRILQEDEDDLMRTETLNPFDSDNGQLFAACGLDSKLLDDMDLASLTSSTMDDPMVELADLRRQVVYLQGEVEDRERTIRLQRNQIENLESKKPSTDIDTTKECINMATQTERTRPFSYGAEGLSRSKPEYTSYTTHYHPAACCDNNSICNNGQNNINNNNSNTCTQHTLQQQQHNHHHHHPHCNGSNNNLPAEAALQQRRHTIISTTLSNYNQKLALAPRRASFAWETSTPATTPTPLTQTNAIGTTTHAPTSNIYKPVKITLIGEPLKQWQWNAVGNSKSAVKTQINGYNTRAISNGNSNIGDGGVGEGVVGGYGECERNKVNSCDSVSDRNGISNQHTKSISKETINNDLCNSNNNGYANGHGTKTINSYVNGKQNGHNVVVMNGQQKHAFTKLNHHSHHKHNQQVQQAMLQPAQQQTHTHEANKNNYQQQQQQQKPLQCYPTSSNNTNGNFNPTVTIV